MKKNILLKIFMVGVFVSVLAVLIYEMFITENFSSQIVTKCFKILVLYGLALCGVSVNGRQRAYERSDQFYADTYKDTIKDAFSNDKRGRKRLILAIRCFNADNPRRANRIFLMSLDIIALSKSGILSALAQSTLEIREFLCYTLSKSGYTTTILQGEV